MSLEVKTCSKCKVEKSVSEFYKHPRRVGQYQSRCKSCYREDSKAQWARKKNSDEAKRDQRRKLAKKYGLTEADYLLLLIKAGDKCEVCGAPGSETGLCIDHHHESGEVRGILCSGCNTSAGMAGDDPVRLEALAAYLRARTPAPASD